MTRYTPMGRSRLAAMKGFLFCCCKILRALPLRIDSSLTWTGPCFPVRMRRLDLSHCLLSLSRRSGAPSWRAGVMRAAALLLFTLLICRFPTIPYISVTHCGDLVDLHLVGEVAHDGRTPL